MKLSTKSRYGTRALVDLAYHAKSGHVSLNSIAKRQNISPKYLEQEFAALRRAGLVKSIKGAQGGYVVGRPAREIRVDEIVRTLEGDLAIVDELDSKDNNMIRQLLHVAVYEPISREIESRMSRLTLADLVRHYEEEQLGRLMYYI
jgi:Rrf2 family protein